MPRRHRVRPQLAVLGVDLAHEQELDDAVALGAGVDFDLADVVEAVVDVLPTAAHRTTGKRGSLGRGRGAEESSKHRSLSFKTREKAGKGKADSSAKTGLDICHGGEQTEKGGVSPVAVRLLFADIPRQPDGEVQLVRVEQRQVPALHRLRAGLAAGGVEVVLALAGVPEPLAVRGLCARRGGQPLSL